MRSKIISIIFILGCFFRIYRFTTVPFGLNHDAGLFGLAAIDLWQKLPNYTPFYTGWVGETMYHYFLGLNFFLFGISPSTIKLTGTVIGITSLATFYFLAKNIQQKQAALISFFFLSISGWHIIMGKSGWSVILVPLFQSLTLAFLLLSLRTKKISYWIITGFFHAATLYTYGAARIIPVAVFASIFLHVIYKKEFTKSLLSRTLIMILSCVIFVLPLIFFAKDNWPAFTSRMNYLSVTNNIRQEKSLQPLLNNIVTSSKMLHIRANGDDFFVNEPLLELLPGILFIIGLIAMIKNIKRLNYAFILVWVFLGFIPGILSTPNGNHDFSLLVPAYLIIGEGGFAIFLLTKQALKKYSYFAYGIIILIFLLSLLDVYRLYFSLKRIELWGFYPETTVVGNYMKQYQQNYNFYLTDNFPRDALTFLTYNGGDPWKKNYIWFESKYDFLTVELTPDRGTIFVMFPGDFNTDMTENLSKRFPEGRVAFLEFPPGSGVDPAAMLYIVPPPRI